MTRCAWCREHFEQSGLGRPRIYCGETCYRRAKRRREAAERAARQSESLAWTTEQVATYLNALGAF
jgi:hypothetical protein